MQGYVIFSSEAVFNTAHESAKTSAGLPKVGNVKGTPAPGNQQTTEITSCQTHPTDGTAVAYINGGWPDNLKDVLRTRPKKRFRNIFQMRNNNGLQT